MKGKKVNKFSVDEKFLREAFYLLLRLVPAHDEPPGTPDTEIKAAHLLKRQADMLKHIHSIVTGKNEVKKFYDLFKTAAGYRYIIDTLVKYNLVIENEEGYGREFSHETFEYVKYAGKGDIIAGLNQLGKAEDIILPHTPPLEWIADKMYFGATIEEIYHKGYLKSLPSRKGGIPELAKIFSINRISKSAIDQSALPANLIDKIKKA